MAQIISKSDFDNQIEKFINFDFRSKLLKSKVGFAEILIFEK